MSVSPSDAPRLPSVRRCRITCGSRLHLGLLNVRDPFGGIGLMITTPQTVIESEHDPEALRTTVSGPGSDRVQAILQRAQQCYGQPEHSKQSQTAREPRPLRIKIHSRPAAHTGLGTGTQLAMAAAEAIATCYQIPIDQDALATKIAARGKRSAVGIHGYFHGGLLVERLPGVTNRELNPLEKRLGLPETWSIALFRPKQKELLVSGDRETNLFSNLAEPPRALRNELETILENELIPAADKQDFQSLSEAIYLYNQRSGTFFAAIQGGAYRGQTIEKFVTHLRARGIRGVGQSSWGPTVFAFFETAERAAEECQQPIPGWECYAHTRPMNHGRVVETE